MARCYEPEMRQALVVTREAGLCGDTPVGAAVLGPDGSPIGVGGNERGFADDPTAHAEVAVIRRVAEILSWWRLTGRIPVVTLEPCTMCAGAIVAAWIDHLMFGAPDDKAGVVASLLDVLRDPRLNHRLRAVPGALEADYAALLEEFFGRRR